MGKTICKSDKYKVSKSEARFECKMCGGLARKEKNVCKPRKY